MSKSRSRNAVLNITAGYIAQAGIIVLAFIGRRIFLNFLSIDYLGINGLYTNILSVLSLAELGLDTAVVFSLYKPVADDDKYLINSLLRYFKRIYFILAACILAVGIALIPFLKYIINSDLSQKDLIIYYLFFLFNSVSTYFVAHKNALLSAYQEQRLQKLVALSSNFLLQILHIAVLLIWKNYYVYIAATVLSTLINNFVIGILCDRVHKNLKQEKDLVLFDKKPIRERIMATFVYRIGAVLVNNTDNILISVLVSTAAVGYYSNYYTIIGALQGFLAIVSFSIISGVGNLGATGDNERQFDIFNVTLIFYNFTAALGFIGFTFLFNDVITVWLGTKYLFDIKTVVVIAFNFYLNTAVTPVWLYREANGLFQKVKYLMLIEAAINLGLSVALGMSFGVLGILLATAVSAILTTVRLEPRILFNEVFKRPVKYYWMSQLKYLISSAISFILSFAVLRMLPGGIYMIIIKAVIICLITMIVFTIINYKSNEFREIKRLLHIAK